MAEKAAQEKTEQPTGKKISEAKSEGQVAKSIEISSAAILMAALLIFLFGSSRMFWSLSDFMGGMFKNCCSLSMEPESLQTFVSVVFDQILSITMPIMLLILVVGMAANIFQTGFMLNSKPFEVKFSKFNPISGMKKIVSLKSLVEVFKDFIKFSIIGGIAYLMMKNELEQFPSLMQLNVIDIFNFITSLSLKICFCICLALIVLAITDLIYQRWQYNKDQMMTKQEVKEEHKQSEGDPKVKGKIKQIQLQTAMRRMMQDVPDADVVVTNPTHLAIALKYDPNNMMAPSVIAKGAGLIAEKIKQIAEEHEIPIVENKPLARTLYKVVEIGTFIPIELYRAVAEILAYVYNLKRGKNSE